MQLRDGDPGAGAHLADDGQLVHSKAGIEAHDLRKDHAGAGEERPVELRQAVPPADEGAVGV